MIYLVQGIRSGLIRGVNMGLELIGCKGCYGDFLEWDISEDGYCESCQYEHEAKQDNLTGDE
jgi:hypothetical protein